MYNSWFQEMRFPLQSIQVLEKAIVSEMLALKDNPKDRAIAQNRINNWMSMIQTKARQITTFYKEQTQMKKQQLAIIEGNKSLKATDKKKTNDVIWQNFYDKVKQFKQTQKKQESTNMPMPENTVQYFRKIVFMPPFKQPEFTIQENKGRYVDMQNIYLQYLNLCKVLEGDNKQMTQFHDYLWFLQNMDKFDQIPMSKKIKYQHKYVKYLNLLYDHLKNYIQRAKPLFDLQGFINNVKLKFINKYELGELPGWEQQHENFDQSKAEYCVQCVKLFINNDAYVNHLIGKKHQKNVKIFVPQDHSPHEQQAIARKQFTQNHQKRKKQIAVIEFLISKFREQLAIIVYDTMNLIRKKQTRGYQDIDQMEDSDEQSEEADAPVYNPKNLPLGWDGKPIPYWLYKLHGLGIQYKCQICGNYSYWGRRAFEMHFQQWRHTYGMRCLKIPNTIHFRDITTIRDALALHQKLIKESQDNQFRSQMQQQFQDNQGNILNKRTYYDMKKQGLID